jgi:hypothetical protein
VFFRGISDLQETSKSRFKAATGMTIRFMIAVYTIKFLNMLNAGHEHLALCPESAYSENLDEQFYRDRRTLVLLMAICNEINFIFI